MNVSEAIVAILAESGVEHIFGLPGDTGMDFYDALYRNEGRIQHILTRDERSASFMADAYARVTGKLGVCEGPSGGGATYIVPGVAEAHGSCLPLLCLTSDTPVREEGRGVLTELNQPALFAPITKWSARLNTAEMSADIVRRAVRLATTDRPGAVALSMPADVLKAEVDDANVYGTPQFMAAPASRTRPDPESVNKATDLIRAAKRPVIIAGGGVLISRAWDALTAFAEAGSMPVGTSINGKGSIAETNRLSLGIVGGNGARPYANDIVAEADLVLLIGTRTDSTTTLNWTLPSKRQPPTVIHIDVDAWQIGNNYRTAVGLIGDARATLEDLLSAFGRQPADGDRTLWLDQIAALKAEYFATVAEEAASDAQPIKPQRVIATLKRLVDAETVLVADPGTPTPFIGAQYELAQAGRWTVIPRAHGGLGYALPAVVGAYHGRPNARTVGLMGDGSFGMSVGELETISRLNLPIVLLHFNNGCFGWIKELQHLYHERRYFSVDFNPVDYSAIARGFGLRAWQVTDPADLEGAMRDALESGAPCFIDMVTEAAMTETPPVHAWLEAAAAQQ
ncbi:MAG TPA: thiamine pyrophosphate-binding protein [Thermomicrobiales bacterium]|nr:thiamine pyrophosphate-binding protein [Thermomicrobiales bacterium]